MSSSHTLIYKLKYRQGFTDSEEFVVRKAINALSALTGLRLLYKPTIYDLVKNTACFLIHPNLWIRQVRKCCI